MQQLKQWNVPLGHTSVLNQYHRQQLSSPLVAIDGCLFLSSRFLWPLKSTVMVWLCMATGMKQQPYIQALLSRCNMNVTKEEHGFVLWVTSTTGFDLKSFR